MDLGKPRWGKSDDGIHSVVVIQMLIRRLIEKGVLTTEDEALIYLDAADTLDQVFPGGTTTSEYLRTATKALNDF